MDENYPPKTTTTKLSEWILMKPAGIQSLRSDHVKDIFSDLRYQRSKWMILILLFVVINDFIYLSNQK